MSITQTQEVPAGPVILTFTPAREGEGQEPAPEPKQSAILSALYSGKYAHLLDPNIPTPHSDFLLGVAAHLGDITLEQIREERLAKYLSLH